LVIGCLNIFLFAPKVNEIFAKCCLFSYFGKRKRNKQAMPETRPTYESDQEQDVESLIQPPAKVILFNDEVHTFEEVIGQIIKATGCDTTKAESLTWEVHNAGKAMVYEGEMTKCVQVSGVLEEIELMTQIEV
jgi:ATP-dependent Clp protease adaptor protein ClpS